MTYRHVANILRTESALLLLVMLGGCAIVDSPAPSLVGMSQGDAERLLQRHGLHYDVTFHAVDSGQPIGVVTDQTPAEHESLPKKAPHMHFQVAVGKENVAIPDLQGRSAEEAGDMLTSLALAPRIADLVWAGPEAAGKVVSSEPVHGTLIPQGTQVDLRVGSSFAPSERTLMAQMPLVFTLCDVVLTNDSQLIVLYQGFQEWEHKLFVQTYTLDGGLVAERELEIDGLVSLARVLTDGRILAVVKHGRSAGKAFRRQCRLVCFSAEGNILWDTLCSEGDFRYLPREVIELRSGDLLVIGVAEKTLSAQPYLVRTRGDGTLIWEQEVQGTGLEAVTCALERQSGDIELFGTREYNLISSCKEPGVACATITQSGELRSLRTLIEAGAGSPLRHTVNGAKELPDGSTVVLVTRCFLVDSDGAYFLSNCLVRSKAAVDLEKPVDIPGYCDIIERDDDGNILVAGTSQYKHLYKSPDLGRPYLASYDDSSEMNWERVVPRVGEYVKGRIVALVPNAYEDGHLVVMLQGGALVWLRVSSEGFAPAE